MIHQTFLDTFSNFRVNKNYYYGRSNQKRIKEKLRFRFKLFIVELAELSKTKKKILQEYNICKSTYYSWKVKYDKYGKSGLRRRKPATNSHPRKISSSTIEKILERLD